MNDDKKLQDIIQERIEDHEERLRKIETNSLEMKYELMNIGKSQSDLKVLFVEQNKEYSKQLSKFIEQISGTINTNNKIRLIDRKETWAVVSLIIGIVLPYVLN